MKKLQGVASIAISSIWAAPLIKFGRVVDNARRAAWEALTAEMRLSTMTHACATLTSIDLARIHMRRSTLPLVNVESSPSMICCEIMSVRSLQS